MARTKTTFNCIIYTFSSSIYIIFRLLFSFLRIQAEDTLNDIMKLLTLSALRKVCSDLFAGSTTISSGTSTSTKTITGGSASSNALPDDSNHIASATLTCPMEGSSSLPLDGGGDKAVVDTRYTCAICLSSIWTKKSGVCDPCGHILHQSCFCEWAMTRKAFFFPDDEQESQEQLTKCPVCNTGVHKMLNMFWTSSNNDEEDDTGHNSDNADEQEGEQENDCSYFAYLDKRVQDETAAIKLRISQLEEQVELVKSRNASLCEQVEQVLLDIKRLKADVEQEKQLRVALTGQLLREQQRFEENGEPNSGSKGSTMSRRISKRKRDAASSATAAVAASKSVDGSEMHKKSNSSSKTTTDTEQLEAVVNKKTTATKKYAGKS